MARCPTTACSKPTRAETDMPNDIDTAPDAAAGGIAAPETHAPLRRTVEAWESDKDIPSWLRIAARGLHRWPKNRELLEEEFDAGVRAARDLALR